MSKITIKGIYRHYRGNLYLVEDVARDTETSEERVVCRALYGSRELWTQPVRRFLKKVKRGTYHGPRMQLVTIREED